MPKALSQLLSEGTLEDAYEVSKHLGAGAFSEVKLARRLSDGQSCAVKILQRDHPEFNEVSVDRLCSVVLPSTDTSAVAPGAAGFGDRVHAAMQRSPEHRGDL